MPEQVILNEGMRAILNAPFDEHIKVMLEKGGKEPEQVRKLFIGGLDYNTKDDGLKEFYEQWGTVVDVVVMKDPKTRRSRGFGFITYSDAYMVDDAMANRPHRIDGRQVEPKRAVPRDLCGKVDTNVRKLFIGGLRKDHEKEDLEEYFGQFGKLTDCAIVVTKDTGEKRGFGFVEYEDVDSADKVVLIKEHELKGRVVEVKKAIAREEIRGGDRGGSRGGGGRDRGDDRRDRGGRGGRDDYRGGRGGGGNQDWNNGGPNNWGGGGGNFNNPWGGNSGGGGGGGGPNWGGNMGGNMGGNGWNMPWSGQGGFPNQGFNNPMNPMMGMGNMGGMGAMGAANPAGFPGGFNNAYGSAVGGGGYNSSGGGGGNNSGYNSTGYNSSGGSGGGFNSGGSGGGGGGPMRSNYNANNRSAPYNTTNGGGSGSGYGGRGGNSNSGGRYN